MITPTLIWYYYICPREVWFMAHQIEPVPENPWIQIGRLISEESFRKELKEVQLENAKVDLLISRGQNLLCVEVKKSSRFLKAARMQLLFYLKKLKSYGIDAKGELRIPREKKRIPVELTPVDEAELAMAVKEIEKISQRPVPPELKKIKYCPKCGYQELCWA
ncbi:MAG: CRISPR-associated protein Cas4 [Candidatus Eremiobacteraeota bacterium]|nr:CRISPR-associated protein Cas4 [Candidatus Eremiobacteraeota bacterium]